MTELKNIADRIRDEISKTIVGQENAVEELLIALFVGGHALIEGVPGVGKTMLAKALARAVDAEFKRIQFTPDLMPSDVVGTNVFNLKENTFVLNKGPIFTDILLADEINRTPPKTQAALLEAMQEKQVTIDGVSYQLSPMFLVCATQNPVEYEGTYPLPEAQLDRFLMKVTMGYPPERQEAEVLRRCHITPGAGIDPTAKTAAAVTKDNLLNVRKQVNQVKVEMNVIDYVVKITAATRSLPEVSLGASPRASLAMLHCAKAAAALEGKAYITPDDVKRVAPPILRHRLILMPEAEVEGRNTEQLIARVLSTVPVPR